MNALLKDLGHWFWRLVPANPILVRVVSSSSRRGRHLWVRIIYLLALFILLMFGVVGMQTQGASSLADLAKGATQTFSMVALAQLVMVCFLAPIFASAAITQERDSQTYNILLATPLSDAQIVFGTLLSRMYFVFVLLLAGLPLFCLMMIYGGVALSEILLATGLAATSAFVAGALAITVAVIRVGTRKTIFMFFLIVGLYLMIVYSAAQYPGFIVPEADAAPGRSERMSWLAAFHPLLALQVVLNQTPAPPYGTVAHYGFPASTLAAHPAASYMTMTMLLAVLLCVSSLSFVRACVKEGEPTWFNRFFSRKQEKSGEEDEKRRRPRNVWANSVAWREAMTRASGPARAIQRIGLLAIGILVGLVLLWCYISGKLRTTTEARLFLEGVIAIEVCLSLLVATNTAATALTREKESGTLDSLLVTPLTSRQMLAGKVRGLTVFAVPMITVPFATVLMFVLYDLLSGRGKGPSGPVVYPEALITLPIQLVAFASFACALGLYQSVKQLKTVTAVVWSIGMLLAIVGITSSCFAGMGSSEPNIGAVIMPFSPVSAVLVAIDPRSWLGGSGASSGGLSAGVLDSCRVISFISSLVSAAIYAIICRMIYSNMVTNFDMTIRKQMT